MLHIYGQSHWHQPVLIAGDMKDLLKLGNDLIMTALEKRKVLSVFPADGEGYAVVIALTDEDTLNKLPHQYGDESLCGEWTKKQTAEYNKLLGDYVSDWKKADKADITNETEETTDIDIPMGNVKVTHDIENNSDDPAELKSEIERLKRCLKAYETAEHRVMNVQINDTKFPPGLTITAPNMDEKRIAEYCIEFYNLFFECAKVVAARNMPMPDLGEVLKTLKELEQTQQQSDSVMPWCQKCKSYHHKKNPSCFDRRATVAEIFRKACIYADLPPGCSAEVMQMIAKMTGMESTNATPENA